MAALDVDNEELLKISAILGEPTRVLASHCDVASPAEVKTTTDKITSTFGRIGVLVNNAGFAIFKPLLEHTYDEWRQVMSVNLDGVFLCTQACAPIMLKNIKTTGGCGAVVNIASISGLRASALRVAYGTSKTAIIHLSKSKPLSWAASYINGQTLAVDGGFDAAGIDLPSLH